MPITKQDIIAYESEAADQNPDVSGSKKTAHMLLSSEPDYIKLYINTVLTFKELPTTLNPLLFELLKYMSNADSDEPDGGQIISLSTYDREQIAKRLGLKLNTIAHSLTRLCKSGVLKRVGGLKSGAYQVNPRLFGSEWKDIKAIRATFDFNTGEVETDFKTGDSKI